MTSLVRYKPGATFHAHPHPDGEEILVLEGVFSDQAGDWPAGTYLLNPEGFEHAPFSKDGCLLFVKLRQYPGKDHVIVKTDLTDDYHELYSSSSAVMRDGNSTAIEPDYDHRTWLQRISSEEDTAVTLNAGLELFVLEGSVTVEEAASGSVDATLLDQYDWLRLPPEDSSVRLSTSKSGVHLLIKTGSVSLLRVP